MRVEMHITLMNGNTIERHYDSEADYRSALETIKVGGLRQTQGAAREFWHPFHAIHMIEKREVG